MISPEIIRRYPFFAGLTFEQIEFLAQTAEETTVEANSYFFHDGEALDSFYLVLEGAVSIVEEIRIGIYGRFLGCLSEEFYLFES